MTKTKGSKPKERSYPPNATNRLHALTAGRCEFRGCNKFTLRHEPTQQDGNYAEKAHIYAFSDRGPRPANEAIIDVNAIENLMLLCQACHKRRQGCAVTPPKPVTDTVQNVQNAVQTAQDVKNKVDQGTAQVTATVSSVRNTLDRFSGE